MASWKGVDFEGDLNRVVRHMPEVETYRESLQALQTVWDNLTVLGELSGSGTEITGMRAGFAQLTGTLLNSLATESRRKVAEDIGSKAQVCIDVLTRNLFERTADIGFLATDSDLCRFIQAGAQADDKARIVDRFREYVSKYSVYSDILLLDCEGRILCQLDEAHPLTRSNDPLIAEALTTAAPYVERYGPTDLQPAAPAALIYAYRVGVGAALGVLCLVFRFDNECARIFDKLHGGEDWSVITLLDAAGRVLASSDPWQIPLGAPMDLRDAAPSRIVRFAGREYLASTRSAHAYQAYLGPGWLGHVMVPLEYAFETPAVAGLDKVAKPLLDTVMDSAMLYSAAVQGIPRQADAIQRELNRAVWNGNVFQSSHRAGQGEAQAINASFSKTLLWEISNTGARTKEIFQCSIAKLHETVLSTLLRDCADRAALAIDIMDRNLYERANDCRWWALTTAFREALAEEAISAERTRQLDTLLRSINGLYTVYTDLILFDRNARVVGQSNPQRGKLAGQVLGGEWARRTLELEGTQAYCVSAFSPTPLYGGRPTYVYCAAVRDARNRVVGGIAVVFDAQPQFAAMLADSLPAGETHGGIAVFTERDGTVLACADDAIAVGSNLELPEQFFSLAPGSGYGGIVPFRDRLYAVGARMSSGYREYKGRNDPYRNEILALVLVPLTEEGVDGANHPVPRRHPGVARRFETVADEVKVELATFYVGESWYGLHSTDIIESVDVTRITRLPGLPQHMCGCVMYEGNPIMVMDLHEVVHGTGSAAASQIIIVRGATSGNLMGLLVDDLGDIPEVPVALIQPVAGLFQGSASLVDSVVKGNGELMLLLSADKLTSRLNPG
jgi:chemotaxis signal transduction protein